MDECLHNHLIRDENMPPAYSCEACGQLFEVEPYGDGHDPVIVRGTHGQR